MSFGDLGRVFRAGGGLPQHQSDLGERPEERSEALAPLHVVMLGLRRELDGSSCLRLCAGATGSWPRRSSATCTFTPAGTISMAQCLRSQRRTREQHPDRHVASSNGHRRLRRHRHLGQHRHQHPHSYRRSEPVNRSNERSVIHRLDDSITNACRVAQPRAAVSPGLAGTRPNRHLFGILCSATNNS